MSGGTGASQKRAYTRTPDGDVTAVRYFTERYSFVKDSLGSVVGAFNSSGAWQGGYSYSPYGETRGAATTAFAVDNPLRYISGYYDTTVGLYRLGPRYYDPALRRFTQADPSGQEKHPYAYAACNPVNASDPTGLELSYGCARAILKASVNLINLGLSLATLIAGAPTIVGSIVATVSFVYNGASLT